MGCPKCESKILEKQKPFDGAVDFQCGATRFPGGAMSRPDLCFLRQIESLEAENGRLAAENDALLKRFGPAVVELLMIEKGRQIKKEVAD